MDGELMLEPDPYAQMSLGDTALTLVTFTGNELSCQPEAVKCATANWPKSQVFDAPKVTAAWSRRGCRVGLGRLGSGAGGGRCGVVSEGDGGGACRAEHFVPVEGEAVSAHSEAGAGDADDGDQPAGPVVHGGAEADATEFELLVAGGNSGCPDAVEFGAQRGGVGNGPLGQGLKGLGEEAVEVVGGQGGEHELARR
jgi:hypothetical protein